MGYLIERTAQVLYVTASLVKIKGKKSRIIIESRPEYAVISLQGLKEQYSISWENLFQIALQHHENNLCIEAAANKQKNSVKRRPSR